MTTQAQTTEATGTQSATTLMREQFGFAHGYLEGTLANLTNEQAHWQPLGRPSPIDAQYAHLVTVEDYMVNVLVRGAAPLMATTYAGKTGFDAPPPPFGWDEWARNTPIDLDALRVYAQAVYRATDECLASLSDDDLSRSVDMTGLGLGMQTVGSTLTIALADACVHCGEISCLKGMQGLEGYPTK